MKNKLTKKTAPKSRQDLELFIDTSQAAEITIGLRSADNFLVRKKISAPRRQSEKLLPAIDRLLVSQGLILTRLKKIIVVNQGDSFTALRIGVLTANALAYALNIPVVSANLILGGLNKAKAQTSSDSKSFSGYNIVAPIYNREANIGIAKLKK